MSKRSGKPIRTYREFFAILLFAPLVVLLLALVLPIYGVCMLLTMAGKSLFLVGLWVVWGSKGLDTLVVYSDRPNWRGYFAEYLVPAVEHRAAMLNWSERKQWSAWSWRTIAFRLFAGRSDCNPIVILFVPWRWPRRFRFFRAIRDAKHNNFAAVRRVNEELSEALGIPIPSFPTDPRLSA